MTTITADVSAIIESHAAETRSNREIAKPVIEALKECGFFKMMLPKKWGGSENTPQEFFAAQMAIAEADMSVAWACGIISVHSFQLAMMDERAQSDVYKDDADTLISSSYNPAGALAEPCEGGFMLSGRWGWSSGSGHCSWALLGGYMPSHGYRTFLVPRADYEIEDTWDVMGLQGTGSNDVVIEKPVFVPDYRTHKQIDGFNCVNDQENPMYGLPWAQTFIRVVNTPAIGALKKALKLFIETRNGSATTDMTKLAGDVEIQERIAKVKYIIAELESILFRNFDEMQSNNWKPTLEQRILYRYQASLVIEKCIAGVDLLFDAAGGRSVFNNHPLQQLWHDIHIARCHVANNPTPFARGLGSTQLGVDNMDMFI